MQTEINFEIDVTPINSYLHSTLPKPNLSHSSICRIFGFQYHSDESSFLILSSSTQPYQKYYYFSTLSSPAHVWIRLEEVTREKGCSLFSLCSGDPHLFDITLHCLIKSENWSNSWDVEVKVRSLFIETRSSDRRYKLITGTIISKH